jgi:hypothetical protein
MNIEAKEIDGELWIKASDHHKALKDAKRPWVGLTDSEIYEWDCDVHDVIFDIEAKLKDKNTK